MICKQWALPRAILYHSLMSVLLFLFVVVVAAVLGHRVWRRKQRRRSLLRTSLSDRERAILTDQVPLLRKLPPELQKRFEGKVNLFLEQVTFHGCNGLDVTEEMELSIAAQACLLVVNNDLWYDHLTTILIYPGAFKSVNAQLEGYVVTEAEIVRTGESWSRGPVILSWAHSEQGAADAGDGHNVVLHEFAHQLDDMSGDTNGAPPLNSGQSHAKWGEVFLDAFDRHHVNLEKGRNTVIDPYGAEGHEEFFATAVEAFFETPTQLRCDEPEVYEQLSMLFRLDPSRW